VEDLEARAQSLEPAGSHTDKRHGDLHCRSRAVIAGTLFDAAQHLGHRTLAMTQRYAHLSPERRETVAALTLSRREAGSTHRPRALRD